MNLDASTDEYFVTASQIFDYCGADSTGTMSVDVLMNKFAPFVKSNKAEYGTKIAELKSLLDPDHSNPEITVSELAMTLNKYSESQKIKVDLEESFNLKGEQAPHDSDSGISTDGFQLLEELQSELREKAHAAQQLRRQLEFADRQHEEALAAVTAERDSLRQHLNMLREENMSLSHVRRDYEEASERLGAAERALDTARRDLDAAGRRARSLTAQLAAADLEKSTLQEQLSRSTAECHRMNELYAARQAALRADNEALRAAAADLAARHSDQGALLQQVLREKVLLEMELKDMLNKSVQPLAAERSIDVSYTEDQMLSELDSLNADSRFVQENHILDDESFFNSLRDDHGRPTNVSLFHELRLSLCNMSRNNISVQIDPEEENLDKSFVTVGTQTDEYETELNDERDNVKNGINKIFTSVAVQTENEEIEVCTDEKQYLNVNKSIGTQYDCIEIANMCTQTDIKVNTDETKLTHINSSKSVGTQFDLFNTADVCTETDDHNINNNNEQTCLDCSKCVECERLKKSLTGLECDIRHSRETICNMQVELVMYEDNLNALRRFVSEGNDRNKVMQEFIDSLKMKIVALETVCSQQGDRIRDMGCETSSTLVQTECEQFSVATQAEIPCTECVSRKTTSSRSLRKYLWEPLKWVFQLFAIVCFLCAVCLLYAVTSRARACPLPQSPAAVPWRWLHAQDLMDLLLRIEYVADVPM